MGKRGPVKKPRVIQMLKGDPGKRSRVALAQEIKILRGLPQCPEWLSENAKLEWARILMIYGDLQGGGVKLLTAVDAAALAAYCEAVSDLQRATEMILKHGDVYPIKTDAGEIKYLQQSPWVAMKRSAMMVIRGFAQEFGFTPSSRLRIPDTNTTSKQADEDDDFACGIGR